MCDLIGVQVGSLDDIYHFVHIDSPSRERRSPSSLHPKHHDLVSEEQVRKPCYRVVEAVRYCC